MLSKLTEYARSALFTREPSKGEPDVALILVILWRSLALTERANNVQNTPETRTTPEPVQQISVHQVKFYRKMAHALHVLH